MFSQTLKHRPFPGSEVPNRIRIVPARSLIAALKDPDARVRELAAQAVGSIGPDASSAVPALIALLAHRTHITLVVWLLLTPEAVVAQGYAANYPVPTELAVGVGVMRDHALRPGNDVLYGGVSFDYDENWWMAGVVEGEYLGGSEAAACRSSSDTPDYCFDAAVLGGLRFRPRPHNLSGFRPFATLLLGSYWQGSGKNHTDDDDDQEFVSQHVAMQVGSGLEFRWPGSFQGIRMSVDFRRVFMGQRDRNQWRVLGIYVVGPRRFKRQP